MIKNQTGTPVTNFALCWDATSLLQEGLVNNSYSLFAEGVIMAPIFDFSSLLGLLT